MSRLHIAILVSLTLILLGTDGVNLGPQAEATPFGGNGFISFGRDMPSEDDLPNIDIFVVDPLTGLESNVTDRVLWEYLPSWSPDGRWIAYETGFGIYAITPDARRERLLIPKPASDVHLTAPAWSPDGMRVAYVAWRQSGSTVELLDLPSRDIDVVAKVPNWVRDLAWSPDGRKIAFEQGQQGKELDIKVLDVRSGRITNLSRSLRQDGLPGDHGDPAWTLDGHIVFGAGIATVPPRMPPPNNCFAYCQVVYKVRPNGNGLEPLTPPGPRDWTGDGVFDEPAHAAPSPDGAQLALVLWSPDGGSGHQEIWTLDLASGQTSKVTEEISFVNDIDWQPRCTVVGTRRDDVLRGTPGRDLICGFGGDDVIQGLGGDDSVFGHRGDDRIVGGPGRDIVVGNVGRDSCDHDKTDFSRIC